MLIRDTNDSFANIKTLRNNTYPGRGFVIGVTPNGADIVQVYWLMGRSPTSRNRRLVRNGNIVRSEPIGETLDPLTAYAAMWEEFCTYVVTNGDQTETIYEEIRRRKDSFFPFAFEHAMERRSYESDRSCTPRISAMCTIDRSLVTIKMATLTRSPVGSCDRSVYERDPQCGYGYCLHTYARDGDPPPSFTGQPYLLPIQSGNIEEISNFYWDVLNQEHRIALATKFIDCANGESMMHIINRF